MQRLGDYIDFSRPCGVCQGRWQDHILNQVAAMKTHDGSQMTLDITCPPKMIPITPPRIKPEPEPSEFVMPRPSR